MSPIPGVVEHVKPFLIEPGLLICTMCVCRVHTRLFTNASASLDGYSAAAHSPYLNSSKVAQPVGTVLQPSSAYSPKLRSSSSHQQQQKQPLQQGQQQRLEQKQKQLDEGSATTDGSGRLLCPQSPDPIARAKLSYAYSFQRPGGSSSKVSLLLRRVRRMAGTTSRETSSSLTTQSNGSRVPCCQTAHTCRLFPGCGLCRSAFSLACQPHKTY